MDFIGRAGIKVNPYLRLWEKEIKVIHNASMELLSNPGVEVSHEEAADIFDKAGATVTKSQRGRGTWVVKIPEKMVLEALETAPTQVTLGARNPENRLVLDGETPRVYFGSGSETNNILDTKLEEFTSKSQGQMTFPVYKKRRGMVADLCAAARLGEHLEHLDFFIRPVNIQDEDIAEDTKDVNKFYACLNNMTKHVMAGLTDINQLDTVIRMGEIITGGAEELRENPVMSFITCVNKSPLQLEHDSTEKMLAIIKKGMPVVLSSSPQGGSSAPIDEVGMVAQINAEILAAVTLSQLAHKGAKVIYGSVPVRARMDNLHDMYGAPEFNQYNIDCVQMAKYYRLPCYSTGGVADAKVPGIQATAEKVFSHLYICLAGPHLLHYAFGLLEETQTFSFEQAVLDNQHIGMVKTLMQPPEINEKTVSYALDVVGKVMETPHRLFARYARKRIHSGQLFLAYPFEGGEIQDETMHNVKAETERILAEPVEHLPSEVKDRIFSEIPGILERIK
jgi:trimethylamine--corrinoid protein Co-methyltransferase